MEKEATDSLSPQGFLNRHLRNAYMLGTLLSNEEVTELRKKMDAGGFSEQFDAYKRFREAARYSNLGSNSTRQKGRFDEYKTIQGDEDLTFNKRACLARIAAVRSDLGMVYGEVDYKRALLLELVLSSPFLGTIVRGEPIDDDARQRHLAYLGEITQFANGFDFDKRVQNFEEYTNKYPIRWTDEPDPCDIPEFDKVYVRRVYDLAGEIMGGEINLDRLYSILSETILRRGKVFKAQSIQTDDGRMVQVLPEQLKPLYFDDIAGYKDQKRFLQVLAAKTGLHDPTIDDIRMIIFAGKPGLGKSLGVRAFLNALPENAKGVVITLDSEESSRGHLPEYNTLMRLASFHPGLHLFAVIEDIDAFAGDRLHFAGTRKFLELDSTTSDSAPSNFHLIATTNRPDVIDPAVTRPGRTAKILVYNEPDQEERKEIARIHGEKNNYQLSEKTLNLIAKKAEGFTPDEIRHVLWSLRFEDVQNPTKQDIEKAISEIHSRHTIEKEAKDRNKKQDFRR
ncbi:MAG: ATP-binding protein [Patescibacteria group bacterium]